jgi:hypothetical protein
MGDKKISLEEHIRRCNYFNLSDSFVDGVMDDFIKKQSHVENIPAVELECMARLLRDYIASTTGKIDVRDYLTTNLAKRAVRREAKRHREATGEQQPQQQPRSNQDEDPKELPCVLAFVLIGIFGRAGTGKTFSMSTYLNKHETTTFTGSINSCTSNLQDVAESHTIAGAYNPVNGLSTKTLFQHGMIRLSHTEVNDIFNDVKGDKVLRKSCEGTYVHDGTFMKNAWAFDQDSVDESFYDHVNHMLEGMHDLFMMSYKELTREFKFSCDRTRVECPPGHSFHQPASMYIDPKFMVPLAKKWTSDPHIRTQEQYVAKLLCSMEGNGYRKPGMSFGSQLPPTCCTHAETMIDEAGLSIEVLFWHILLMWYAENFLNNTPQLHTRRPVFLANGSSAQGKVIGGFPCTILSLFNAVSSQCKNVLCVDNLLIRRRTDDPREDFTVLHNNITTRKEFNFRCTPLTLYVLRYQEVGAQRMTDSHFNQYALRMCQKHDTCTTVNSNLVTDGVATIRFKDKTYASHRVIYMDNANDKNVRYPELEDPRNFPKGTRKANLSVIGETEAARNIAMAFLEAYRVQGRAVDEKFPSMNMFSKDDDKADQKKDFVADLATSLNPFGNLEFWIHDDCSLEERETYLNMVGQSICTDTLDQRRLYLNMIHKNEKRIKKVDLLDMKYLEVLDTKAEADMEALDEDDVEWVSSQQCSSAKDVMMKAARARVPITGKDIPSLLRPADFDPTVEKTVGRHFLQHTQILANRAERLANKAKSETVDRESDAAAVAALKAAKRKEAGEAMETDREEEEEEEDVIEEAAGNSEDTVEGSESVVRNERRLVEGDSTKFNHVSAEISMVRKKEKDMRMIPCVVMPARLALSAEQHYKMRSNVRPMEYYLKDNEMYDSAVAQNQSGSRQARDNRIFQENRKNKYGKQQQQQSKSMYDPNSDDRLFWSYVPDNDMVRIIAWTSGERMEEICAEECKSSGGSPTDDTMDRIGDRIARLVNDTLCDFQMYTCFEKERYMAPNSIAASTMRATNTVLKGVKSNLNNILTERHITENTSDAFKVCLYVQYIELCFKWCLKFAARKVAERERRNKQETDIVRQAVTLGNRKRQGGSEGDSPPPFKMQKNSKFSSTAKGVKSLTFIDVETISFVDLFTSREYKPYRDELGDNVLKMFHCYHVLLTHSEEDKNEMVTVRNRVFRKTSPVDTIGTTTTTTTTTSTYPTSDSNSHSNDSTTDIVPKPPRKRHYELGAFPDDAAVRYYISGLQKIVQIMLVDEYFNEFCDQTHSVYVEHAGTFYQLFRHKLRDDTYTVGSIMQPGSLTVLGNGYHEACDGDVEKEDREHVSYEVRIDNTKKLVKNQLKNGGGVVTNERQIKQPFGLNGIVNAELKKINPKYHRECIVTYLIHDTLIGVTVSQCNNRTTWDNIFTKKTPVSGGSAVHKKKQEEQNRYAFGHIMRSAQPNGNCPKKNTFASLHTIPTGNGVNLPVEFHNVKMEYASYSKSRNFQSNVMCKSGSEVFYLKNTRADNVEQRERVDKQKKLDAVSKKVDTDATFTLNSDACPSNTTTLAPTQGQTFTCKALLPVGDIDPDTILLAITRLDRADNYVVTDVDTATKRNIVPGQIKPVGGSSTERVKELMDGVDPDILCKHRRMRKAMGSNMIYRP